MGLSLEPRADGLLRENESQVEKEAYEEAEEEKEKDEGEIKVSCISGHWLCKYELRLHRPGLLCEHPVVFLSRQLDSGRLCFIQCSNHEDSSTRSSHWPAG